MHQIRFWLGLRPGPRWGAHDAPPDPLVGWGGGHPLLIPPRRLDSHAFRRSSRRLRRLASSVPPLLFFHSLNTGGEH